MSIKDRVTQLKSDMAAQAALQARKDAARDKARDSRKARLVQLVARILGECKSPNLRRSGDSILYRGRRILRLEVCLTEHETNTGTDARGDIYRDWEVLLWDKNSPADNQEYGKRLGDRPETVEQAVAEIMVEYM